MVCIAAFIILIIIGLFIAIISIFKREVGKAYLKMMKKALGCVGKKVRLQKCETGFKEDVKNTVLSKVIIKHPKWVKPLSIIMEVVSVIIVVVTVWALLTAIKSLLALWALGTCNVTKPAACSLGAEVCSIDEDEPKNILESTGRWFTEWGEIFGAIPDKFRDWNPEQFDFATITVSENDQPLAIDILDPGCSVCLRSYLNQKSSGFFENHNVKLVPFAIQNPDDSFKFKNSEIIVRIMLAAERVKPGLALMIIDHIFADHDENGIIYQTMFNNEYTTEQATAKIETWLEEAGVTDMELKTINGLKNSDEITNEMQKNRNIVENDIHVKGIPTMLYDGSRHTGLYKTE